MYRYIYFHFKLYFFFTEFMNVYVKTLKMCSSLSTVKHFYRTAPTVIVGLLNQRRAEHGTKTNQKMQFAGHLSFLLLNHLLLELKSYTNLISFVLSSVGRPIWSSPTSLTHSTPILFKFLWVFYFSPWRRQQCTILLQQQPDFFFL